MNINRETLVSLIEEEIDSLIERCQKGYKTHHKRKTKKMFGKRYRNCVKAEEGLELDEAHGLSDEDVEYLKKTKEATKDAVLKRILMNLIKSNVAVQGKTVDVTKRPDQKKELDEKKKKKRKKAGTESSKESSLRDWFGRKGAKGKKKGWVDCNAPDGKGGYKSCGRASGEKRKKYPACRPTPGACKERGKGKSWGKKAKKKKNEGLDIDMRKGFLYEGDDSILEMFQGATLDDGSLVCEACLFEVLQEASCGCPDLVAEAEYRGRKVKLNKPMRGDVKKFKVYVKDPKTGNVKKVNFGDKNMRIKKSNPKRRKSFRARHNCDNPGPKTKARYWSCRKW